MAADPARPSAVPRVFDTHILVDAILARGHDYPYAVTPRTQAILPVSLFGPMPDYAAINALAARHGWPVIEDAAQSFGATQHGQRSGGVTTLGSTSFVTV